MIEPSPPPDDGRAAIWSAVCGLALLCLAVLCGQWLYWSERATVSARDRADLRVRVDVLAADVAEIKTEVRALRGATRPRVIDQGPPIGSQGP